MAKRSVRFVGGVALVVASVFGVHPAGAPIQAQTAGPGPVMLNEMRMTRAAAHEVGAETFTPANWWNTAWRFRVPVTVSANGVQREDKPAEVALDFTSLLTTLGRSGSLEANSLRVLEVNGQGDVVDDSVVFQFDEASDFNAAANAEGTLIVLMEGMTAASASRYYHVYFDTTDNGPFTPLAFTPQITVTDNISHEAQSSFKIQTQNATYYYHKQGAGFASLDDTEGKDWIGYHPGGGSAGEYRGIPNLGDWAHPGYPVTGTLGATSTLSNTGPLKATLYSITTNGQWSLTWEMYPTYARMTLLTRPSGGKYWFLYEGTPWDQLNPGRDYYVLSNGIRQYVLNDETVTLSADLASPEWIYFGDDLTNRVLFVAHHEDDTQPDYFRQMQDNMTVFGFGRQDPCCTKYLSAVPAHFTIGFGVSSTITQTLNSAYINLSVSQGQPEELNRAPVLNTIGDKTVEAGSTLTFMVSASDPDGAVPGLSASDLPGTATFVDHGSGTGTFNWTPTVADVGNHLITFMAADGAATDSETISITVTSIPVTGGYEVFLPLIRK
jgi:hypothetical protein